MLSALTCCVRRHELRGGVRMFRINFCMIGIEPRIFPCLNAALFAASQPGCGRTRAAIRANITSFPDSASLHPGYKVQRPRSLLLLRTWNVRFFPGAPFAAARGRRRGRAGGARVRSQDRDVLSANPGVRERTWRAWMPGRRGGRGVFLLVTFLCTSKEKLPARPQAEWKLWLVIDASHSKNWIPACAGMTSTIKLDSRFRGNDVGQAQVWFYPIARVRRPGPGVGLRRVLSRSSSAHAVNASFALFRKVFPLFCAERLW